MVTPGYHARPEQTRELKAGDWVSCPAGTGGTADFSALVTAHISKRIFNFWITATFCAAIGTILAYDDLVAGLDEIHKAALHAGCSGAGDRHCQLVVRLEGTNVEKGKEIINSSGLNVIAADDLKDGAEKIVAAVKG